MAAKGNGKQTTEQTTVEVGTLIPQPHGGAIRNGGTNKGGPGAPKQKIRRNLIEILERGLPVLEGYVEGRVPVKMVGKCEKCGHEHEDYKFTPFDFLTLQTVKATDRLKALEIAARYGGLEQKGALAVDPELMNDLAASVSRYIVDADTLEAIREEWLGILASRLGS